MSPRLADRLARMVYPMRLGAAALASLAFWLGVAAFLWSL